MLEGNKTQVRHSLGDVVYVMWKPLSDTLKSEWKWSQANGPVVCKGAGVPVLQNFPRTGSPGRRPSRIYKKRQTLKLKLHI